MVRWARSGQYRMLSSEIQIVLPSTSVVPTIVPDPSIAIVVFALSANVVIEGWSNAWYVVKLARYGVMWQVHPESIIQGNEPET